MHNQHTNLSQTPAEPHIAALYEQATHRRPLRATNPPRRRRASSSRRWWQLLTRRPSRAS
jgi:hypothetical protein